MSIHNVDSMDLIAMLDANQLSVHHIDAGEEDNQEEETHEIYHKDIGCLDRCVVFCS